jgi:hypothetical protein
MSTKHVPTPILTSPFLHALPSAADYAKSREPVILRIRMRRGLLERIKAIVAYDRQRIQEAWNLSDGVREVLLSWVEQREAEINAANGRQERLDAITLR